MARMPLPIQEAIRDLTGDLLGRGTAVDKERDPIPAHRIAVVCGYRDKEGTIQAVVPMDQALVTVLGGSLVMVPEAVVKETLEKETVPDNFYENVWEVANIMASLLNKDGASHVVLVDRHRSVEEAPADMQAVLDLPVRQRWFSVTVTGYGSGRMGFVAAS